MKKFAALLLALLVMASLAACGGNTSSAPAPAPASESTAAPAGSSEAEAAPVAAGSKGVIEFWTVFTGADGTSMQAIVDAYNATNPEYTVNHRAIAEADLYLKMPLAIQSGQDVPDVCINHVERIPMFQENGFLVDYTPYLEQAGIEAANYNEKAWSMTDIAGGHYGIPLDTHSTILYVNMDLYEQYGQGELDDGLLTWDELRATAAAMEGSDVIPYGFSWLRANFLAAYAQLGGALSEDGTNPSFNNEAAKEVLENWVDLYNSGYTQVEGESGWQMFLGGQVLYNPRGIWMYNDVKEAGLNIKMLDYPVFDTGMRRNWTSSHNFVLPVNESRDDEKTLAVLAFIDYVGNHSLEWAEAGQAPAHVSIKEDPAFQEMPQAFLTEETDELLISDYKYYGYAVEALDKVLPEILYGRMEIEAGLAQAEQETLDRIATEG